ncbi:hypothetical protein AJ88_05905 [Mesorhizobium amorphae CCBAU 01583]|nr:hypothetical protein AJ88_05905 [Mesorhizobium amorphae CCBAU 01583]
MFWLVSGIVGLIRQDEAADILVSRGVPTNFAQFSVLAAVPRISWSARRFWSGPWPGRRCWR